MAEFSVSAELLSLLLVRKLQKHAHCVQVMIQVTAQEQYTSERRKAVGTSY
jgi:hypothetical protein